MFDDSRKSNFRELGIQTYYYGFHKEVKFYIHVMFVFILIFYILVSMKFHY